MVNDKLTYLRRGTKEKESERERAGDELTIDEGWTDGWMDGEERHVDQRKERDVLSLFCVLKSEPLTGSEPQERRKAEGGGSSAGSRLFNPILPPHRHFPNAVR